MTALADMEELLASISNKDMVDYMREAQACYGAGAYRGCIVMSYLALFDDMRAKLAELAKINATAKTIWQEVEKRSGDQEVFESYMADQLQKAGLLTTAEHKQLGIIRDLRNRAAHPSGVQAKAEEARFVYRTVIDDFLSRQLLKTTHAVDAVVERLEKSNVFPTTDVEELIELTRTEVANVHAAAYSYLVKKLIEARASVDAVVVRNAERMIVGLAGFHEEGLRAILQKQLIKGHAHDLDYGPWIGRVVAEDGQILKGVTSEIHLRVRKLLEANADKPLTKAVGRLSHPARQLGSIVQALGEAPVLESYADFVETVLDDYPYAWSLLDALTDAPKLRAKLVEVWLERAGSSTFDTANAFAAAMPQLDDYAGTFLTDEQALKLVVAVVDAAGYGARRSKALRAESFKSTPKIAAQAVAFAKSKPKASSKLIETKLAGVTVVEFVADELGQT